MSLRFVAFPVLRNSSGAFQLIVPAPVRVATVLPALVSFLMYARPKSESLAT